MLLTAVGFIQAPVAAGGSEVVSIGAMSGPE